MLFVHFIFGLLIVIALAIFIRMAFYIYSILIYKGGRSRSTSIVRVPQPDFRDHSDPEAAKRQAPVSELAEDVRRVSIHPNAMPSSAVVRDAPRMQPYSEPRDSIVSQVVTRDGKLVVLNYSMTDEFTLVKKTKTVSRQPSAPPLEIFDDEPPSYDDVCTQGQEY